MKNQRQLVSGFWSPYPVNLSNKRIFTEVRSVATHLADLLAVGPFYYYFCRTSDYRLSHPANAILSIHGLDTYPESVQQIIDLIHPEDIEFVLAAEKAILKKSKEVGLEDQLNLKISYCFRMRVAGESYHLFHHQAIPLSKDEEGRSISALHIHTDIQHLSGVNTKIVTIHGIGKLNAYQIDLSKDDQDAPLSLLSRREIEILGFLAQGLSSRQIADKLYISPTTVRVHRKHMLKKTGTTNTSSLINKCFDR